MKRFLFVIMLAVASFGQGVDNWNGWGDTAQVKNLYKDTTIYTKWFPLSAMENMRLSAYFRDTSTAGLGSDSVNVEWGIQTGHPSWVTTTTRATKYALSPVLIVDTCNMLIATNFIKDTLHLDADYAFLNPHKLIDSVSVPGWAYQTRQFAPEWDVYFRFYAHALTGTKKSKNLQCYFQSIRRLGVKTGN
jgi:hypothetical protein